jgi:hypothetical protein
VLHVVVCYVCVMFVMLCLVLLKLLCYSSRGRVLMIPLHVPHGAQGVALLIIETYLYKTVTITAV